MLLMNHFFQSCIPLVGHLSFPVFSITVTHNGFSSSVESICMLNLPQKHSEHLLIGCLH